MDNEESKPASRFLTGYDLFGYLVPGAVLLSGLVWMENVFKVVALQNDTDSPVNTPFSNSIYLIPNSESGHQAWMQIPYLLALLVLTYVTGHVVSSVSSLFLDRVLLNKGIGYPTETLILHCDNPQRPYSKLLYKGIFFWSNLLFLAIYGYVWQENKFWTLSIMVLFCGIVIAATAHITYWTLKSWRSRAQRLHHSTSERILSKIVESHLLDRVGRFAFTVFGSPGKAIGRFFKNFIVSGFTREFRDKFVAKFRQEFALDPYTEGSNVYWLVYNAILHRSGQSSRNLQNWLTLYSFARNLSASFFLLFAYSLFYVWYYELQSIGNMSVFPKILPLLFFTFAWIMYLRYYFLYVSYYSKYLLRTYVFLPATDTLDPAE